MVYAQELGYARNTRISEKSTLNSPKILKGNLKGGVKTRGRSWVRDAMKLYDGGRAPNPRRVRIFLAEKGISVPIEPVDIGSLQHKSDAYTAINPLQRLPAL